MTDQITSGYGSEPPTNGKVLLRTTLGDVDVELWPRQAPKAVRNFVQLCADGYYDDCQFFRVISGFMAQTGDPNNDGSGGLSSFEGKEFAHELHSRLSFSHRGIVAMASSHGTGNGSQFFVTLDKCQWLNGKHTIFGKVTGNTIFNVLKLNDVISEQGSDRPVSPPSIICTEILLNPFDDIVARVSRKKAAKSQSETVETSLAFIRKTGKRKRKRADSALLSFGGGHDDGDCEEHSDGSSVEREIVLKRKRRKRNTAKVTTVDSVKSEEQKTDESTLLSGQPLDGGVDFSKLSAEQPKAEETEDSSSEELETQSRVEAMREEYRSKRFGRKQRQKDTLDKLNDFMSLFADSSKNGREVLHSAKATSEGKEATKRLDAKTGIDTENVAIGEDSLDANWFRGSFQPKRRPQDYRIYDADDFVTLDPNRRDDARELRKRHRKAVEIEQMRSHLGKRDKTGSHRQHKHRKQRRQ